MYAVNRSGGSTPSHIHTYHNDNQKQERYEVHHGVRIRDSALVAAAQLSHRYISDRFLPDKAIDLVDEAVRTYLYKCVKSCLPWNDYHPSHVQTYTY